MTSEEGKISQQSIITIGTFVTSSVISASLLANQVNACYPCQAVNHTNHQNSSGLQYQNNGDAIATHTHHHSHQSHHSYCGKC